MESLACLQHVRLATSPPVINQNKNLFHRPLAFGLSSHCAIHGHAGFREAARRTVERKGGPSFPRGGVLRCRAKATTTSLAEDVSAVDQGGLSVETKFWKWEGYNIRYQEAGNVGPAVVLVHGFGANCDHWRKNILPLAEQHRVFAIDLLGYGFSDKPDPRGQPPNTLYTFERWGRQLTDFCDEVVGGSAFMACNSVGGLAGLQAAVDKPDRVRGLLLLNISLRMLHITKQQWYKRPFVKALQNTLRTTDLGRMFFKSVAKPEAVKKILCQAYHNNDAVTDELVSKILEPGLQPGAVDVFLDFICYSSGPLPEELLPKVQCPVLIGWGEKDPWEPVNLGRAYGDFATVEDFVVLKDVGHCPQDEAPTLVNDLLAKFIARHAKS